MKPPKAKKSFYRNLNVRRCLLMSSPFWLAAVASQDLGAVTYNATDLASLRAAINNANAGSTNDVINVAAGTYTLTGATLDNANTSGDLDITKASGSLQIIGAGGIGGSNTIISGNSIDRVFHINAGVNVVVTIQALRISNGRAVDSGAAAGEALGGGILLQQGGLTLSAMTIVNCTADGADGVNGGFGVPGVGGSPGTAGTAARGGGVYATGGTVQVVDSSLSSNIAQGGAGGAGGGGGTSSTTPGGVGGAGAAGAAGAAGYGGGVYMAAGSLSLLRSTLGNYAYGGAGGGGGFGGGGWDTGGDGGVGAQGGGAFGGSIYTGAGVTVTITESHCSGDFATGGDGGNGGNGGGGFATFGGSGADAGAGGVGQGGALYIAGGTVSLINSTFSDNTATAGDGGDGGNGGSGYVTTSGTGLAGTGGNGANGGNGFGGGIAILGGSLNISNSTIAFGTANLGAAGAAGGRGTPGLGGVNGAPGTAGTSSGGGVYQSVGTVTVNSSIFSDSTAATGPDFFGNVTAGASLFEVAPSGTLTAGTGANITGQDPLLGPLQINGGPTLTRGLLAGSPARDVGTNPLGLTTDQRGTGFPRIQNAVADMGAFEALPPGAATPAPNIAVPAAPVLVNAPNSNIQGTALPNSMVRIYSDANNNGIIDGTDAVVGSQQLTGGSSNFSITVNLTQNAVNDFTATADDGSGESDPPANVPTITEDSLAPTGLVVTNPATPMNFVGASFNIQGTAEADSLVQVYSDLNDNGAIDGTDAVVASGTATGGNFSISTALTLGAANNFTVTAEDAAGNESTPPVNVPTITETTALTNPPVVTSPAGPVTVNQATFLIEGTATADSLVRIYSDANDDGLINGVDSVLGQHQLVGGSTSFSVNVVLAQNAGNNYTVTADDTTNPESNPVNVPTITDNNGGGTGGPGGGGGGGGCAVSDSPRSAWLAFGAMFAAVFASMRQSLRRRQS